MIRRNAEKVDDQGDVTKAAKNMLYVMIIVTIIIWIAPVGLDIKPPAASPPHGVSEADCEQGTLKITNCVLYTNWQGEVIMDQVLGTLKIVVLAATVVVLVILRMRMPPMQYVQSR